MINYVVGQCMKKKLNQIFFNQDAERLAKQLLGKVLRAKYRNLWLSAQIIETEAYYIHEKSSHSSLGFTKKRKALFMPAGTIYMYYSRGNDSMNISAKGEGNAVLIKSGVPFEEKDSAAMIKTMQRLNPIKNLITNTQRVREKERLCSGKTLLCKSLHLTVREWDQQQFDDNRFFIEDVGYRPKNILKTTRLGIPADRDAHLPLRFIDADYALYATDRGRGVKHALNPSKNLL